MIYQDLKNQIKNFRPVLNLERHLPHHTRKRIIRVFSIITGLFFLLVILTLLRERGLVDQEFNILLLYQFKIRGLFFISLVIWTTLHLLDSFFYSYYFDQEGNNRHALKLMDGRPTFELATIIYQSDPTDLTDSFLKSHYGKEIMTRLGLFLNLSDLQDFLKNKKEIVDDGGTETSILNIADYATFLFNRDKEFADYLFTNRVEKDDLMGAALWVENDARERMVRERWWSRDSLGRVPGLGKSWAYGQIGLLKQYGYDLTEAFSANDTSLRYNQEEIKKLETVLSRSQEANAILINDSEAGNLAVISILALEIKHGLADPSLEHKRMFLLDTNDLISANKDKTRLEEEMRRLFQESVHAGNIILVIENFPGFIESAKAIGSDIRTLIMPILMSTSIQIIATSDTRTFHTVLEPDKALMQHFETLLISEKGDQALIELIEKEASLLERHYGVFFTYQSLKEIAKDSKKYFNDVVLSDKAGDLLLELAPKAVAENKYLIEAKDVLTLIQSKTGIPTGEVKADEKEKLLNLEALLHERIIGQDQAVVAVSQAMRRSRSGIESAHKPIGSFLFLGPTGVGKTETTKALNEAYFGKNAEILRLDMSEYSSSDALNKMIGSFEQGTPGVLSTMLREHPYGVLLLDEFEKTTSEVKNLFLQILDEGSFKDMSGRAINAENLIIIATSNAGSELIWEIFKSGGDVNQGKDKIIDQVIKGGIFKPELLNRFDKVILFHPLNNEHLEKVAKLMLSAFEKRLREKGVRLVVTDDLVNFLVKIGADPKFGARPMNRAIADKVEALIAEELIKGTIGRGETIKIVEDPGNPGNLKVEKGNV